MPPQDHLLAGLATIAGAVVAVLAVSMVVFWLLYRYGMRSDTSRHLRERAAGPSRLAVATLTALIALPAARLGEPLTDNARHALAVLLIVALAWLAQRAVRVVEEAALRRYTIEMKDNLHQRRKRTQALVVRRLVSVVIIVLAAAAVLLTFEDARALGASLLASAGVAGLVAGIAARTTLGNLIAGLQIVFTEPIRIDDVVVLEGEWGKVEEITLTYVVVRIWDARRLVLPTTYFVEQPFQNWTRSSAQVLGAVNLHVDYATPVEEVRTKVHEILQTSDKWDGDAWVLQVIDATDRTIELRALMTAEDAPTAWDLRCEVREQLVAFLQEHHPRALPRLRVAEAEQTDGDRRRTRPGAGRDLGELEEFRDESWTGDDPGGASEAAVRAANRGGNSRAPRSRE